MNNSCTEIVVLCFVFEQRFLYMNYSCTEIVVLCFVLFLNNDFCTYMNNSCNYRNRCFVFCFCFVCEINRESEKLLSDSTFDYPIILLFDVRIFPIILFLYFAIAITLMFTSSMLVYI